MAATVIPAMGHDEKIAIGAESTFNSAATPNAWYRPVSFTMTDKPQISPMGGPTGVMVPYKYDASLPRHFADVPDRSGQLVVECDYDYVGHLLAAAIFSSTDVDSGTDYCAHTFTIPSTTPTYMMDSLTVQRRSTIDDWEWTGVVCNQLTLRGQPGQYITATLDLVGAASDLTGATFETPEVLSAEPWMEFYHSDIGVDAALSAPTGPDFFASTGAALEEWTLTINNNLDISQVAGGGSASIRAPTFANYREISLEWTHRWDSTYDFTSAIAPSAETGRYRYVQLKLDDGVSIGGGQNSNISVSFPQGIFVGDMNVYEGGGGFLRQHCRVVAAGGSANPVTVILINDVLASGAANYGANAPS